MKTIIVTNTLSEPERETNFLYNKLDNKWIADTTFLPHYNKLIKQGWKQIVVYTYKDGTVCGGQFEGTKNSISIRNPSQKRTLTEEQKQASALRLQKGRENKKKETQEAQDLE